MKMAIIFALQNHSENAAEILKYLFAYTFSIQNGISLQTFQRHFIIAAHNRFREQKHQQYCHSRWMQHFLWLMQHQGLFQQFWEKAPGQNWEKNDRLNIKTGRN